MVRGENPQDVRRTCRQPGGETRKHIAELGAARGLEEKCAQTSSPARDARLGDRFIDPEGASRVGVEWRRITIATNRTRDRRQSRRGIGRTKKLGDGGQRRDGHAPTLATRRRISAIKSSPTESFWLRRSTRDVLAGFPFDAPPAPH